MSAFGTKRTFQSLAVSPVSLWHTASLQLPCRPAASRPPWSVAYAYEMRCERSPAPMSPRRFPPSRKRNLALVNTQEKGRFGGLSFWGLERPHILTKDRPKRLKHIEAGESPKPRYRAPPCSTNAAPNLILINNPSKCGPIVGLGGAGEPHC